MKFHNIHYTNGRSPLIVASFFGCAKSVKKLLEYHANINHQTYTYGSTPLLCACLTNKIDVVEILLSKNADPTICTNKEWEYGKVTLKAKV